MSGYMELSTIDRLVSSDDPADRRQAAGLLAEVGGGEALNRLEKLVVDPHKGVREVAQDSLIFIGDRDAVRRIAPLVGSADAGIRNTAIEILRRIGEDGLDILHGLTQSPDDRLRLFIVDILGSIGSHESVNTLIQCLFDENPNVRNQTVISLGNIGDPRAFIHLRAMINDEEWIRFSVIEALAKIPHAGVVDFLLHELERWSYDEITLSAILETLGNIPSEKAIRPLLEMIDSAGSYIQTAMVNTLLKITPDIASLEKSQRETIKYIIEENLAEADDELLKHMLTALARIGDRRSAERIIACTTDVDPDTSGEKWEDIRNALIDIGEITTTLGLLDADEEKLKILGTEILSRIGGEAEAEKISQRIPTTRGYVKRAFVQALAQIAPASVRDTFRQLVHDDDGHVAAYAIRALGNLGYPEDIDELKPFLSHPYADVREMALDAIARIGSMMAEETFLALLGSDDAQMRITGLRGLARLDSPCLTESALRMVKDSQSEVRLSAAQIAKDTGLALDNETLQALLADDHHEVRFMAIDIVGRQRMKALRHVLDAAIRSDDQWMAFHAIEALGRFQDDDARTKLLDILSGEDDFLRIAAVKALGEWGDEGLAEELEIYNDDQNPDVGRAVSQAINKLRGRGF